MDNTTALLDEETFEDPRGAYPPIPAKVIEILIKKKMITFPIPPEQEWGIRLLQHVWRDKMFLRFMLAEMDREERVLMAEYPRYTKVDRYVLRLLLGVRGEDRGIPDNDESVRKKYPTKVIQEMVMC